MASTRYVQLFALRVKLSVQSMANKLNQRIFNYDVRKQIELFFFSLACCQTIELWLCPFNLQMPFSSFNVCSLIGMATSAHKTAKVKMDYFEWKKENLPHFAALSAVIRFARALWNKGNVRHEFSIVCWRYIGEDVTPFAHPSAKANMHSAIRVHFVCLHHELAHLTTTAEAIPAHNLVMELHTWCVGQQTIFSIDRELKGC